MMRTRFLQAISTTAQIETTSGVNRCRLELPRRYMAGRLLGRDGSASRRERRTAG